MISSIESSLEKPAACRWPPPPDARAIADTSSSSWLDRSETRCAGPPSRGGSRIRATKDEIPSPVLAELGRQADLYIMEATFRDGSVGPHLMTAREAGAWASQADPRRLMLTHFAPGSDREASIFGPVIARIPRGEEALRIWDAFELLVRTPGFAELKRSARDRPTFG